MGGIYDDRFLVKPTKAAIKRLPKASHEAPYRGGKEMLPVDNVDDRFFLQGLLESMYEELPFPKERNKKTIRL